MKLDIICFVNPVACVSLIPSNFFVLNPSLSDRSDTRLQTIGQRRLRVAAPPEPDVLVRNPISVLLCDVFFALYTSV
jgi:hypothetical protein